MDSILLILRPQPGAAATADRVAKMGLRSLVAPLFVVRPLRWTAPDPGQVEALLVTSANAARAAGGQLHAFSGLPCYAVGESSAEAARAAGQADVRVGPADGKAAVAMIVSDGFTNVLHLCGREHLALDHPELNVTRRIVYASEALGALPDAAAQAVERGTIALIHSPRAGATFAELVTRAGLPRDGVRIAAISDAAARSVGPGWASVAAAAVPRDAALLELAAKLCKSAGGETGSDA
jgi:uroporphyrinogen-III synthase